MIDAIKNNDDLFPFCYSECCDEDDNPFCIEIDSTIDKNNNLCVLDVDEYYKSLKLSKPPKSIDCLIVQKCNSGKYGLYLIELKNLKRLKPININDVVEKFKITIECFIKEKFKNIFLNKIYEIRKPCLYFVVNFKSTKTQEEYEKIHKNTRINRLLIIKPFEFRGYLCKILPVPPNLTIEKC